MNYISHTFSYIQYLFIRLAGVLYKLVPAYKAYDFGASITTLFYPVFKKRRQIAIDNILQAKITEDPKEADRIARLAFGHLAGHICEAMKADQIITDKNWLEHITLEMSESSRHLLFEEKDHPLMMLGGHLGVWEAGVTSMARIRPLIAIARKMNNPYVERFLNANHFRGKVTIVDKNKGLTPSVIKQWKRTSAIMAIVMDQHAGKKNGVRVDFMGRKAGTHTSPARLHLRTGIPVITATLIRKSPFKYTLIVNEPIRFKKTGDNNNDIKDFLTLVNKQVEKMIRNCPEQYLWAHKRWRPE
ncbi:MAG: lysophospholipid acyltransferase family protein [Kiritimatiellae bacterium]|jgi:KDO2-lipid IV(A) lauroyltransferase|nr:lysophospholipid acyltransferase family protein [Kiritimatiellia bacterium]